MCSNFDGFRLSSPLRRYAKLANIGLEDHVTDHRNCSSSYIVSPVILSLIFNREYWFVSEDSKSSNACTYTTHKVALVQLKGIVMVVVDDAIKLAHMMFYNHNWVKSILHMTPASYANLN